MINMKHQDSDYDLQLKRINGREVRNLSPQEFCLFEDAVRKARATRLYDGPDGFGGFAKVKVYARPI
jgi:hypothetical protein